MKHWGHITPKTAKRDVEAIYVEPYRTCSFEENEAMYAKRNVRLAMMDRVVEDMSLEIARKDKEGSWAPHEKFAALDKLFRIHAQIANIERSIIGLNRQSDPPLRRGPTDEESLERMKEQTKKAVGEKERKATAEQEALRKFPNDPKTRELYVKFRTAYVKEYESDEEETEYFKAYKERMREIEEERKREAAEEAERRKKIIEEYGHYPEWMEE